LVVFDLVDVSLDGGLGAGGNAQSSGVCSNGSHPELLGVQGHDGGGVDIFLYC
jgi:hypothetical protein